jgi:hypothetical protein
VTANIYGEVLRILPSAHHAFASGQSRCSGIGRAPSGADREQNRLIRVFADTDGDCTFDNDEWQFLGFHYDALGRRVVTKVPGAATRYYYDGQRVIEERDASDAVKRYHVNGGQFIDEHVATYEAARAGWTYYLHNANYSVVGMGDGNGNVSRLDYSASGDFTVGSPGSYAHDADADADIDLLDFANLQLCYGTTDSACLDVHDFDVDGNGNGVIDFPDFGGFVQCFNGPNVAPLPGCELAPPSYRRTVNGKRRCSKWEDGAFSERPGASPGKKSCRRSPPQEFASAQARNQSRRRRRRRAERYPPGTALRAGPRRRAPAARECVSATGRRPADRPSTPDRSPSRAAGPDKDPILQRPLAAGSTPPVIAPEAIPDADPGGRTGRAARPHSRQSHVSTSPGSPAAPPPARPN